MCDLAALIIAFAREISTVVHPHANHARCSHVDLKLGSLWMWWLGVEMIIVAVERASGSVEKTEERERNYN